MWSGSRHWPIQADWADREYGARTLGDARLRRRLVDMGRAWADRPGLSLPQVFASNSPYSFILGLMSVFSCFGTGNRRFQTVCMACRRALERVPGIDMQVS